MKTTMSTWSVGMGRNEVTVVTATKKVMGHCPSAFWL